MAETIWVKQQHGNILVDEKGNEFFPAQWRSMAQMSVPNYQELDEMYSTALRSYDPRLPWEQVIRFEIQPTSAIYSSYGRRIAGCVIVGISIERKWR